MKLTLSSTSPCTWRNLVSVERPCEKKGKKVFFEKNYYYYFSKLPDRLLYNFRDVTNFNMYERNFIRRIFQIGILSRLP